MNDMPRDVEEAVAGYTESLDPLGSVFLVYHSKPKGFRDEPRSWDRELMLIASELFEAFEDIRKVGPEGLSEKIPDFTVVEEEFADAIIRLLETGAARGLRLGEAVHAKFLYNLSRPHKHGKAF